MAGRGSGNFHCQKFPSYLSVPISIVPIYNDNQFVCLHKPSDFLRRTKMWTFLVGGLIRERGGGGRETRVITIRRDQDPNWRTQGKEIGPSSTRHWYRLLAPIRYVMNVSNGLNLNDSLRAKSVAGSRKSQQQENDEGRNKKKDIVYTWARMWQSERDALKPIFGIYRNLFASALHRERGFRSSILYFSTFRLPHKLARLHLKAEV